MHRMGEDLIKNVFLNKLILFNNDLKSMIFLSWQNFKYTKEFSS